MQEVSGSIPLTSTKNRKVEAGAQFRFDEGSVPFV
jgi:hypothetical protein